tara:strand:- start:340 stop:501 length:162 start_codon:yes stop_codon:yes gene_type:complete
MKKERLTEKPAIPAVIFLQSVLCRRHAKKLKHINKNNKISLLIKNKLCQKGID